MDKEKLFEKPEAIIINFQDSDIILTSNLGDVDVEDTEGHQNG